jgi:hypothetical protein
LGHLAQRRLHAAAVQRRGRPLRAFQATVAVGEQQYRIAMHLPEATQHSQRRRRQRHQAILVALGIADMHALTFGVDMLLEITQGLKELLIGDKGYIRPSLKEELARQALDLQTPLRKNMQDPRPKAAVSQLMKARRLVETVIGQLTERFHIEKVRARDAGIRPIALFANCSPIRSASF